MAYPKIKNESCLYCKYYTDYYKRSYFMFWTVKKGRCERREDAVSERYGCEQFEFTTDKKMATKETLDMAIEDIETIIRFYDK